jgi:hypothetical protein
MSTQARPMGVFNEWGKLREVLVGDSARCVFPRWSPDWGRYHGFKTMLHGLEGVPLQQAMPERAKGMREQTGSPGERIGGPRRGRSPSPPLDGY